MNDSKTYVGIIGFAILYAVSVFLCAFLGFLNPVCWVGFPILAALVGAFSYFKVASHLQTFGAGMLCALVLAAFLFASGELKVTEACLMLSAGIVSDIVRMALGNKTVEGVSWAYPVLSLGNISWILPLWTRTDWYYVGAIEEMGKDYADGLMPLASGMSLFIVIVLTLLLAYLGIRLAARWMKSSLL
jgi:hypothetical protein